MDTEEEPIAADPGRQIVAGPLASPAPQLPPISAEVAEPVQSLLESVGRMVEEGVRHVAAAAQEAQLARLEKQGLGIARLSEQMKSCAWCRFWFVPSRSDQRYCRPACRQAAFQRRRDEVDIEELLDLADESPEDPDGLEVQPRAD
jgi:hypothetical protein